MTPFEYRILDYASIVERIMWIIEREEKQATEKRRAQISKAVSKLSDAMDEIRAIIAVKEV